MLDIDDADHYDLVNATSEAWKRIIQTVMQLIET
jgi:hypothetical protein